jgi:hypothetical protein
LEWRLRLIRRQEGEGKAGGLLWVKVAGLKILRLIEDKVEGLTEV